MNLYTFMFLQVTWRKVAIDIKWYLLYTACCLLCEAWNAICKWNFENNFWNSYGDKCMHKERQFNLRRLSTKGTRDSDSRTVVTNLQFTNESCSYKTNSEHKSKWHSYLSLGLSWVMSDQWKDSNTLTNLSKWCLGLASGKHLRNNLNIFLLS